MYKTNKLWNGYFPRSQRISYWYREIPQCPSIYIIDLNKFLLLLLLTITKQKYFSFSPKLLFNYIVFEFTCSLWFDLGTLRIILLRSPTLGSDQAPSSRSAQTQSLQLAPSVGRTCVLVRTTIKHGKIRPSSSRFTLARTS